MAVTPIIGICGTTIDHTAAAKAHGKYWSDFRGVLLTDGFSGYESLVSELQGRLTAAECWTHTVLVYMPTIRVYMPTVQVYMPTVRVYMPAVLVYMPAVLVYMPMVQVYMPTVAASARFFFGGAISRSVVKNAAGVGPLAACCPKHDGYFTEPLSAQGAVLS